MIAEKDAPLGVWNYRCPTCGADRGFICWRGERATQDVHNARLEAYRADPTWTAEAEAADRYPRRSSPAGRDAMSEEDYPRCDNCGHPAYPEHEGRLCENCEHGTIVASLPSSGSGRGTGE